MTCDMQHANPARLSDMREAVRMDAASSRSHAATSEPRPAAWSRFKVSIIYAFPLIAVYGKDTE